MLTRHLTHLPAFLVIPAAKVKQTLPRVDFNLKTRFHISDHFLKPGGCFDSKAEMDGRARAELPSGGVRGHFLVILPVAIQYKLGGGQIG